MHHIGYSPLSSFENWKKNNNLKLQEIIGSYSIKIMNDWSSEQRLKSRLRTTVEEITLDQHVWNVSETGWKGRKKDTSKQNPFGWRTSNKLRGGGIWLTIAIGKHGDKIKHENRPFNRDTIDSENFYIDPDKEQIKLSMF